MVLNERDKKGNTALHMATRKARSQVNQTIFDLCF
jgi:ankyrin repeat protein